MSFWHQAYLFDGDKYQRWVGGARKDPGSLTDWGEPLNVLRERWRKRDFSVLPRWKRDIFQWQQDRVASLLRGSTRLRRMDQVLDLNMFCVANACVSKLAGLEYWNHLLETSLNRFLGNRAGERLVMGTSESGPAWDFVGDYISYKFGFARREEIQAARQTLRSVTVSKFRKTLVALNCESVYPFYHASMDEEEVDIGLGALKKLKSIYDQAASRGLGVFFALN